MKILYLAVSIIIFSSCVGYTSNEKVGEVYYNLGNAYLELGRNEDAIKAYSHALGMKKNFVLARYNIARTYAIRKEYDKALESTNELLSEDPDSLVFRELKAWIYYLSKDYSSAIAAYEDVLEIDPIRETTLFNLAILYSGKDDHEESLNYFVKLVDAYPDNEEYVNKLGSSYFLNKKYEETISVLNTISAGELSENEKREYYFTLGMANEKTLEYTEALELYVQGQQLEEDVDNREFFFLEGRLQWNVFEDPYEAENLFDTAIEKGYNDKVKILEFIEDPETINKELAIEYFEQKKLYDPEAGKTEELTEEEQAQGNNGATENIEDTDETFEDADEINENPENEIVN